MAAKLAGNTLQLRFLGSTETGSAEDQAKHALYTIAFYTSSAFTRQP